MKIFHSLFLFLTFALGLTAASAAVYQCPMHPCIKSDKPGDKCTICGMDLVAAPVAESSAAADPSLVTLTPPRPASSGSRPRKCAAARWCARCA